MPKQAMNLTFGDFILIEIALCQYMKDLDLSMMSGQYISQLLGKLEYELGQLQTAANTQLNMGLTPDKEEHTPLKP